MVVKAKPRRKPVKNPRWKYNKTKDFRWAKPKLGTTTGGYQWTQVSEELIGGRWEPFVGFPGPVYKTRVEGLKHFPKKYWH